MKLDSKPKIVCKSVKDFRCTKAHCSKQPVVQGKNQSPISYSKETSVVKNYFENCLRVRERVDSYYTSYPVKFKTVTKGARANGYLSEGTSCYLPDQLYNCQTKSPLCGQAQALYSYHNSRNNDHLYSTNSALKRSGYVKEGEVGHIFKTKVASSVPLFEFRDELGGNHLYSVDLNEPSKHDKDHSYVKVGVVGYVYRGKVQGSIPLYSYTKVNPVNVIQAP